MLIHTVSLQGFAVHDPETGRTHYRGWATKSTTPQGDTHYTYTSNPFNLDYRDIIGTYVCLEHRHDGTFHLCTRPNAPFTPILTP